MLFFQTSTRSLMDSRFDLLRSYICANDAELARFRQLTINVVMATDIVDTDLKALRNARWAKAFSSADSNGMEDSPRDSINRKATIV